MSGEARAPLLTLEPLIEAVREGVTGAGWTLSGLQKTTSHQFEGRWAGDETRSAYLFFHLESSDEPVSVDVYLDETSRGLTGNLALVVDLHDVDALGPVPEAFARLAASAARGLPAGYRSPLTLRLRLPHHERPVGSAETEVRFKVVIPPAALEAGASAVSALCGATVTAFERLLRDGDVRALIADD